LFNVWQHALYFGEILRVASYDHIDDESLAIERWVTLAPLLEGGIDLLDCGSPY